MACPSSLSTSDRNAVETARSRLRSLVKITVWTAFKKIYKAPEPEPDPEAIKSALPEKSKENLP